MGHTKDYMFDIQEDIHFVCDKYALPLECKEEGYDSLYEIQLSFNDRKFTFRFDFHSFDNSFGCYISVYDYERNIGYNNITQLFDLMRQPGLDKYEIVNEPKLKMHIENNFPNERKAEPECYATVPWSERNLLSLIMIIQSYFSKLESNKVTVSYI